jgi:hypothetical protein
VMRADSEPRYKDQKISFQVRLRAGESWHLCLHHIPLVEGKESPAAYACHGFDDQKNVFEKVREDFLTSGCMTVIIRRMGGPWPRACHCTSRYLAAIR